MTISHSPQGDDRARDTRGPFIYLVMATDFDDTEILAAFNSDEMAERYRAEFEDMDGGERNIVVRKMPLNPTRSMLPGVYEVELSLDGEVVAEGWATWTSPDQDPWDDDVPGAHWWRRGRDKLVVADTGACLRAIGRNREQAVRRGRELLALAPSVGATDNG